MVRLIFQLRKIQTPTVLFEDDFPKQSRLLTNSYFQISIEIVRRLCCHVVPRKTPQTRRHRNCCRKGDSPTKCGFFTVEETSPGDNRVSVQCQRVLYSEQLNFRYFMSDFFFDPLEEKIVLVYVYHSR
jgi:hypothetical protein